MKKILHVNRNPKRPGVAILASEKIDVKSKITMRQSKPLYIDIRVSHQEYVTIINIYAPKTELQTM